MSLREYHGCWREYNVQKGKGEAISSHFRVQALGENINLSSGGRGRKLWGRKSRCIKY